MALVWHLHKKQGLIQQGWWRKERAGEIYFSVTQKLKDKHPVIRGRNGWIGEREESKLSLLHEKTYPVLILKTFHFNWNFLPWLCELLWHFQVSQSCLKRGLLAFLFLPDDGLGNTWCYTPTWLWVNPAQIGWITVNYFPRCGQNVSDMAGSQFYCRKEER